MRDRVIGIKWALDVVGEGKAKQVLATDRAIRRSIEQTDKLYAARSRTASASEKTVVRAREAERRATERATRAAQAADRQVRALGRSSSTSSAVIDRGTRVIHERATAYERLGKEAEQSARRESAAARRRASAMRAAGGVGGMAARGGRAAGRTAGRVAAYGTAGVVGVGLFQGARAARNVAEEYQEAIVTGRATNAVIKSTGGVANVTSKHLAAYSQRLSAIAGVDDELIQKGGNLLLTFKNVRNEVGSNNKVFDRTQRAAVNMSAAFKAAGKSMDISSASLMLGKALNDPEKGMAKLTRSGVSFTQQQIDQVKKLTESGKTLAAQKVILREVESEFGGAARKTAMPLNKLRTNIANVSETIGMMAAPKVNRQIRGLSGAVGDFERDLSRIGKRKDLSLGEKVTAGLKAAKRDLGPFAKDLVHDIGDELEDADVGSKLGRLFEKGAPKIVDAIAAAAPHAFTAFVHAFRKAGIAGQLLTAGFILKKLGLAGAAAGAGKQVFKRIFAGGGAAGAGGLVGGVATRATPVPVFVTNPGGVPGGGINPVPGGGWKSRAARGLKYASRIAPIAVAVDVLVNADEAGLPVKVERAQLKQAHQALQRQPALDLHGIYAGQARESQKALQELDRQRADIARKFAGSPFLDKMLDKLDAQRAKIKSTLDYYTSAALREAPKAMGRQMFLAADRVAVLRKRLDGLKEGSQRYRRVARQLEDAQANLNSVVAGGSGAFRGVGDAASNAASAMNTAAATIDARVQSLATSLRSHGIAFNVAPTGRGREAQDVTFGPVRRISPGDGGRRGGVASFSGGGMVPAFVSSGEMVVQPNGASWTVPGPRVAADNVFAHLPAGSAVLTSSGQSMMAGGASLHQALAMQAPHFSEGGRVPIRLRSSQTRAGLLGDALAQGIDAGTSGLTRPEIGAGMRGTRGARINPIIAAIRGAMTPAFRTTGSRSSSPAAPTGDVAGTGVLGKMTAFAASASKRWPSYVYGGGHNSSFTGPYDCSGAVSAILHAGGFLSSPQTTDGLKVFGQAGDGKLITIGVRGSTGRSAHTMIKVGGTYWEAGSSGFGQRSGWSGVFPIHRHPNGFRRGGIAGQIPAWVARRLARSGAHNPRSPNFVGWGLRGGGGVPALAGARYEAIDRGIGQSTVTGLGTIYREVQRTVRRGGSKKVIQKLQGILDLIDFELGRRIGRLYDAIQQRSSRSDRRSAAIDRNLRRQGIDPSSSQGLALTLSPANMSAARANVRGARTALSIARRTGNKDAIRAARGQLYDARGNLAEARVGQIETVRGVIVGAQQEISDMYGARIDRGRTALDRQQRRSGIDPASVTGLQQQSIGDTLEVSARQRVVASVQAALNKTKNRGTRNQLQVALQDAQDALDESLTMQAERARELIYAQAQERVDTATHGTSMAQLGQQRLELEQRIAGTYDTGGQARADYIKQTLIPSLNAELTALQDQQRAAQQAGDPKLANQIAEAVAGKQNDILQATADAAEQTATNTEALKEFGGTLGFAAFNQDFTDLITAGVGA